MSVDATRWAWGVDVSSATKRLVLLSLADRAGEEHTCYPSTKRVVKDTCLDRKTILKAITDMIDDGLIFDTGERKGNGVRVLKLVGVNGRENETHPKKITDPKNGTSAEIGITTDPKNGITTDPNFGTQNLKENLKINLTSAHAQFDEFWKAYPNKKDKKRAEQKFSKINFKKHSFEKIMSSLDALKKSEDWLKENGKYIPMASTWINGERWNDIEDNQQPQNIEVQTQQVTPTVKYSAKPKNYLD